MKSPAVPNKLEPGLFLRRGGYFRERVCPNRSSGPPGVKAKNLKIDLRENILTLTAVEDSPQAEKETDVFREYECGTFFRQFTLAETIDQAKIEAELHDGVLRLQLPKTEAARPRQIAVKAS